MPYIYQTGIVSSSGKYTNMVVKKIYHAGNAARMRNNLEKMRIRAGLTRNELADKLGTTETTIYRKERAVRQLKMEELDSYSAALGCRPEDLLGGESQGDVPIVANIGAGAQIVPIDDLPLYRNGLREADKPYANCETVEPPPGYNASEVLAVRVIGDSMMPFMPEGTIVYYSTREHRVEDCLKKLCVVQIKGGETYLKILKKGEKYGRFNLQSYNASEIEDVEVMWCAKVIFIGMG